MVLFDSHVGNLIEIYLKRNTITVGLSVTGPSHILHINNDNSVAIMMTEYSLVHNTA